MLLRLQLFIKNNGVGCWLKNVAVTGDRCATAIYLHPKEFDFAVIRVAPS